MKIKQSAHSHAMPVIGMICFSFLTYGIFVYHSIGADSTAAVSQHTSGSTAAIVSKAIVAAGESSAEATPPSAGVTVSAGDSDSTITDPNVVARIGSTDVKLEDMRKIIASLTPDEQAAVKADPVFLMKVVRTILLEQLVMKEISAKQWGQQPEVLAHLERIRETTIADMYLRSVSMPADDFPSDAELHKAYEANKASFSVPHQFKVSQIFIAVSLTAEKEIAQRAQNKLNAIQKKLQEPNADFAAIAKSDSDDNLSGTQGGDMGWLVDTKMPAKIRAQALALPRGIVSAPVRLNDGYHILKVMDTRDLSVTPFEQVRESLTQRLRTEREHANRLVYLDKMLQASPVVVNDQAVFNLVKKAEK